MSDWADHSESEDEEGASLLEAQRKAGEALMKREKKKKNVLGGLSITTQQSARLMAAAGRSQREIAGELGVNQSTVARWLK